VLPPEIDMMVDFEVLHDSISSRFANGSVTGMHLVDGQMPERFSAGTGRFIGWTGSTPDMYRLAAAHMA
jgi:hypothetical protein